ncbi:MAG: S1C family serine protease [Anaerolineales bacterium]
MKGKAFKSLYILGVLVLLIGSACGGSSGATDAPAAPADTQAPEVVTEAPVKTEAPAETQPPAETEEPQPESGAVSSLQDVKGAVIQIEAQGTFIDPEVGLVRNGAGRGSGFIIDPSGIAVTNNHVVTGAGLLKVFVDGEEKNAKVLGVSECSDLAVIDIDGDDYPYLEWYQGPVEVGMDLYVAGFPLGDPEYTLTKGIISKAKAGGETSWASVDSVIEYDATSNPGNSGGPVITPDGKVLAVHYAGDASARQAFGISEAVAARVIERLRSGENLDSIGINGQAVGTDDGSLTGIWVASVQSGSPADKAGLEAGDIITMMENLVLATDGSMSQYCDILRSHSPEDTLSVEVLRWPTGELLEGQLNGRELAVSGVLSGDQEADTSNASTTTGSTYYNPEATESEDVLLATEFDDTENWYTFTVPETDKYDASYQNSRVIVEVNATDTSAYLVYDGFLPPDVRVDTAVELVQGTNRNNISLLCRASDAGWYEFSMNSGGYWFIWKYEDGKYNELARGASKAINMQKTTNEITATCIGTELTFYVNQTEMGSVRDNRFKDDGQVGVSVSTFDIPGVGVEFDWFAATVP